MGEVKRAIGELAPIASLAPGFAPVQEKLLELFRLGDDRAGAVESLLALARIADAKGDSVSSAAHRRQILEVDPENPEARAFLRPAAPAPAPPPPAPGPVPAAVPPPPPPPPSAAWTPETPSPWGPAATPPAAESSGDLMLLDLDDSLLADPGATPASSLSDWGPRSVPMASPVTPIAPPRPSPMPESPSLDDTAMRRKAADEAQWRDSITEAEVFVKYGLLEKAVEKYRTMLRRRKDAVDVRCRYVELLAESNSPALLEEAATLAGEYRRLDRPEEAEKVLDRFLPAVPEPPAAALLRAGRRARIRRLVDRAAADRGARSARAARDRLAAAPGGARSGALVSRERSRDAVGLAGRPRVRFRERARPGARRRDVEVFDDPLRTSAAGGAGRRDVALFRRAAVFQPRGGTGKGARGRGAGPELAGRPGIRGRGLAGGNLPRIQARASSSS